MMTNRILNPKEEPGIRSVAGILQNDKNIAAAFEGREGWVDGIGRGRRGSSRLQVDIKGKTIYTFGKRDTERTGEI